jgi:hypothetical protein
MSIFPIRRKVLAVDCVSKQILNLEVLTHSASTSEINSIQVYRLLFQNISMSCVKNKFPCDFGRFFIALGIRWEKKTIILVTNQLSRG